jgi:hypothetical protein
MPRRCSEENKVKIRLNARDVPAENWFRAPFPSKMERDALVVDIPVSSSKCDTANPKKIIRLCTTHLESLPEPEGKELRPPVIELVGQCRVSPDLAALGIYMVLGVFRGSQTSMPRELGTLV